MAEVLELNQDNLDEQDWGQIRDIMYRTGTIGFVYEPGDMTLYRLVIHDDNDQASFMVAWLGQLAVYVPYTAVEGEFDRELVGHMLQSNWSTGNAIGSLLRALLPGGKYEFVR